MCVCVFVCLSSDGEIWDIFHHHHHHPECNIYPIHAHTHTIQDIAKDTICFSVSLLLSCFSSSNWVYRWVCVRLFFFFQYAWFRYNWNLKLLKYTSIWWKIKQTKIRKTHRFSCCNTPLVWKTYHNTLYNVHTLVKSYLIVYLEHDRNVYSNECYTFFSHLTFGIRGKQQKCKRNKMNNKQTNRKKRKTFAILNMKFVISINQWMQWCVPFRISFRFSRFFCYSFPFWFVLVVVVVVICFYLHIACHKIIIAKKRNQKRRIRRRSMGSNVEQFACCHTDVKRVFYKWLLEWFSLKFASNFPHCALRLFWNLSRGKAKKNAHCDTSQSSLSFKRFSRFLNSYRLEFHLWISLQRPL